MRVNAQLTESLERCRDLVADCRSKLAANSNEPLMCSDGEEPSVAAERSDESEIG